MSPETLNILRAMLCEIERVSAHNATLRQLLAECAEELPHWREEKRRKIALYLNPDGS